MASPPMTTSTDLIEAERLQSTILFLRSLQEHINEPAGTTRKDSFDFPVSISASPDHSPHLHTSAATSYFSGTSSHLYSSRRSSNTTRTYSPRLLVCPSEWDGQPAACHARIYRLNPPPWERKKDAGAEEAEVKIIQIP